VCTDSCIRVLSLHWSTQIGQQHRFQLHGLMDELGAHMQLKELLANPVGGPTAPELRNKRVEGSNGKLIFVSQTVSACLDDVASSCMLGLDGTTTNNSWHPITARATMTPFKSNAAQKKS
jgi:hypothetical protein